MHTFQAVLYSDNYATSPGNANTAFSTEQCLI